MKDSPDVDVLAAAFVGFRTGLPEIAAAVGAATSMAAAQRVQSPDLPAVGLDVDLPPGPADPPPAAAWVPATACARAPGSRFGGLCGFCASAPGFTPESSGASPPSQ